MVAINTTSVIFQSIITILNITAEQEESTSYNYYYMNIGQEILETNASKCYGMYGCFGLAPPWTSEHRPVSLFPESIKKVEPKLTYYTRENPIKGTRIDLDAYEPISSSGIDPLIPLYTVTHGYTEGGEQSWIKAMTRELLIKENCNVIVIDWQGGSSPPYTQAVANIRLVGAITAHLLAEYAQYTGDLKLDHVHCIGHSLGAHLSGYIGYTLQTEFGLTLGRITGLDPAEPHFAKAARPVRLDKSAAKYVDVVHTDASQFIRGGLGMTEAIGHVDYYPNGGTNQPGCGKSMVEYTVENGGSFFMGMKKFLACNHVRSHQYFLESINTQCPFVTIACKSYEDFIAGNCMGCDNNEHHCIKFGYHGRRQYEDLVRRRKVHPSQGLVQYLMTSDRVPYCRAHYKISVLISDSSVSKQHGGEIGRLWFVLHNTTDRKGYKTQRAALNAGGYHEPGVLYTSIVPSESINHIKGVEVEWGYSSSVFNPLTWRLLASPRLHVAKIKIESLETRERLSVCPKDKKPLVSGLPQLMLPSYCT